MNNEELNTALYEKMFTEQETYRAWLLSQTPEEILNHTYEYTVREDILISLEYHDLPDGQARALLKSPSPLADVFADWENEETDYMKLSTNLISKVARVSRKQRRTFLRQSSILNSAEQTSRKSRRKKEQQRMYAVLQM